MARRKRKERNIDQSITQPAVPFQPTVIKDQAWRAVGAAVQGVSHERLGLPCQDVQAFRARPDGILLVALADGAGSARYSDRGARIAVDEALRVLDDALQDSLPGDREGWERVLREAFSAARTAVREQAGADPELPESAETVFEEEDAEIADDEPRENARDYAATLTCVVAAPRHLAVGQVGDGAVVAMSDDEELFAVTRLQRGEYANETHFITQEDALDQLVFDLIERPVKALAVMSDGLIRLALKMPTQEPHAPFFQPLFRFATSVEDGAEAGRQLAAFLTSERVNARTDDDKSLVLAVRLAVPESIEEQSRTVAEDRASLDREGE